MFILFISLIGISVHADSSPSFCVVLVTTTSGGFAQPEGAITVPFGSGISLAFTPYSGYTLNSILVDGSDAGQYPSISLSHIVHDMTVHVIFAPEGPTRSEPVSPLIVSPPPSGSATPSFSAVDQTGKCPGYGCEQEKTIIVGPPGSDYTRIQEAITNASPGDTIYIKPGTYEEQITIQKPLSLIGLEGESGRPVISPGANGTIITISADDVLIRNLSLISDSADPDDDTAIVGTGISRFTLQNCVISNPGTGINLNMSENISISDCSIRNISQIGMHLTSLNRSTISGSSFEQCRIGLQGDQLTGLSFRNNLISANIKGGAIFKGGLSDADISGNMFTGNGESNYDLVTDESEGALYLEHANNVTISGNNLTQNHGIALTLDEAVHMTITRNTLLDNYAGFTYTGNIPDPGNLIDESNMIDGLPIVYYEGVSGEKVEGISPSTLYLMNCNNMTVHGLTLRSRNGYGILVKGGSDISISNCSVEKNLYQNILIAEVTRGNITGSEVLNGSQYGIGLINTAEFGLFNCIIQDNAIGAAIRGDSYSVNMKGNNLMSNEIGFQVEDNPTLFGFGDMSGNRINGGMIGFSSENSNNGIVNGNEVTGPLVGIDITGSHGLHIEGNRIDALYTGLRISGLHPENYPYIGSQSIGSYITRNSISAGNYPILINDTREWVFGNYLLLNDFVTTPGVAINISIWKKMTSSRFSWGGVSIPASAISNASSQQSTGNNSWDTGERVRYSYNGTTFSGPLGNHWSNYTGNEIGTSGVGDLPVHVNTDNTDNYPLIGVQNRYLTKESGYHLELYPGWNFISTPTVLASGSDTAQIFEGVDTVGHSMYSFINSTWIPMKSEDLIAPLHGYWLYSGIRVDVPLSFDPGLIPEPAHLLQGWNAIGYPGIQQAAAHDALSSLDASWSYAVGYDADVQGYGETIVQEEGGDEIMYPSQGYWLYMKQDWVLQPITG